MPEYIYEYRAPSEHVEGCVKDELCKTTCNHRYFKKDVFKDNAPDDDWIEISKEEYDSAP